MARKKSEDAAVDLTPMIDVVFQLIIFFIVTIKMDDQLNKDIILEDAPHGPIIEEMDPLSVVLEVDRRGHISMRGAPLSENLLFKMLKNKYARYNQQFPVYVRADWRTKHKDVKKVMDICTKAGLWRINFMAVQEHKLSKGRHLN